jgi:hypothetical protein
MTDEAPLCFIVMPFRSEFENSTSFISTSGAICTTPMAFASNGATTES